VGTRTKALFHIHAFNVSTLLSLCRLRARNSVFLKKKMERVCARWIQCNSQRSLLTGYIVSFAPSRASVVPAGFHMQQQQHHVVYVRLPQTKRTCRRT